MKKSNNFFERFKLIVAERGVRFFSPSGHETIIKDENKTMTVHKKLLKEGYSKGWTRTPWAIVLHYTGGFTEPQTYDILEKRGISVHFCAERNGKLVRYLEDSNRGWHAGESSWAGKSGMNHNAFGVEIVNFGWADGKFNGHSPYNIYRNKGVPEVLPSEYEFYRDETYKTSSGKRVTTRVLSSQECESFPDHRKGWDKKLWAEYPEQQIQAVAWQCFNWMKEYNILPENIIGHEHVSPGRKTDPGPAFPWDTFEKHIRSRIERDHPKLLDVNFNRKMRVKAVQSHCARMGLPVGDIDGWWGKKTEAAVKEAVRLYGKQYGIQKLKVNPDNLTEIAHALRKVPGFSPGRK